MATLEKDGPPHARFRFRVSLEWLIGLGASAAFAVFLGTGKWPLAAAVIGALLLGLLVMAAPFALMLAWLLGAPTVLVLADNALPDVPFLTAERGMFLVVFGLLVARALTKPRSLHPVGPVERAMGLYLLVILLSWAAHAWDRPASGLWGDTALFFDAFLMPFGAFLIARNGDWTPQRYDLFLWLLVLGAGGYLMATGLAEEILGWTWFKSERYPTIHPDRVSGSFSNALAYGMIVGCLQVMSLALYLRVRDPWLRAFLVLFAGGLMLCVLLSKGRAVWLAMPLVAVFLFAAHRPLRPLIGGMALLGGILGIGLVPFLLDLSVLQERLTDMSPIYDRVALWATSLNMIADRPIFGFGFGEGVFHAERGPYLTTWGDIPLRYAAYASLPHNEFLYVTVLMGAVGLVVYLNLLGRIWATLRARARREPDAERPWQQLAVPVQAALLIALVNALFLDLSETSNYSLVLLFFLVGLVAYEGPSASSRHKPPHQVPA